MGIKSGLQCLFSVRAGAGAHQDSRRTTQTREGGQQHERPSERQKRRPPDGERNRAPNAMERQLVQETEDSVLQNRDEVGFGCCRRAQPLPWKRGLELNAADVTAHHCLTIPLTTCHCCLSITLTTCHCCLTITLTTCHC